MSAFSDHGFSPTRRSLPRPLLLLVLHPALARPPLLPHVNPRCSSPPCPSRPRAPRRLLLRSSRAGALTGLTRSSHVGPEEARPHDAEQVDERRGEAHPRVCAGGRRGLSSVFLEVCEGVLCGVEWSGVGSEIGQVRTAKRGGSGSVDQPGGFGGHARGRVGLAGRVPCQHLISRPCHLSTINTGCNN